MKKYEKLYVRSRQETTRDWCRKWREVVTRSSRQRRALTQKEKGTGTYTQTQYSHASERRTSLCRLCGNATKTLRESTHNGLPMRPLRVKRGFRTKKWWRQRLGIERRLRRPVSLIREIEKRPRRPTRGWMESNGGLSEAPDSTNEVS